MDMTRCLLNEANLPKHLWRELAAPAVFLIHRLPKFPVKECGLYVHDDDDHVLTLALISLNRNPARGHNDKLNNNVS
ncbi:unnamed protein product, partial [Laminaria digitata]